MTWREQAACSGAAGQAIDWFPTNESDPQQRPNIAAAKTLCEGCPVRESCLHDALVTEADPQGIRGGLTGIERRRMRRPAHHGPRPGPIAHGTTAGYQTHRRRGEIPCDACRQANSNATRRRRLVVVE